MKHFFSLWSLLLTALPSAAEELCTLQSPDGSAIVFVNRSNEGALTFSLQYDGVKLLDDSRMEMLIDSLRIGGTGWKISTPVSDSYSGEWHPLWGKRAVVKEEYNAVSFSCMKDEQRVTYQLRAYDDGVAWRCLNEGVSSDWLENSDFCFSGNFTAWYYNGEKHNIGPEPIAAAEGTRQPLMTVKADKDHFLTLHEACVYHGKPLLFQSKQGSRHFDVVSEPTLMPTGEASAWRVVMLGHTAGDLVDSHLIELLNPEPDGDFSWVHPGIYLWDWRIDGAEWEGFNYGMDYTSWVRMVDFAKEQGFTGLVLDANWYGPEFEKDSNPVSGEKARDVQRIIAYGKARGIGLWLYLNDVAGSNYPIEETIIQYEKWGAAGVKYGFMEGSPSERNEKTILITRLCAKHHLCVDFHDHPVHPWGQARTWPNALTREYCKAQLDGHQIFYPKTFVTSAFVNMVAGPIDQNNGFLDLRQGPTTRVDNNQEVPSTVCAEVARVFITYSGADVIPDIPEYYHKYPHLLEFLAAHQQPWRESKTLSGEIGEYIVMMRQARDGRYIVAAATDEEARDLTVDLSFLPEGNYTAKITEDGKDAHYISNHTSVNYREELVIGGPKASVITLHLAPGGGACILLE